MARFGSDIMSKMNLMTKNLEITLGPGTGDLSLRIGMHSGPVTAGVLRGERARFQLFGDTMNTCSRLETSSYPGRIHTSKETADLIRDGGRCGWLVPRMDKVEVKGKGDLGETFWVHVAGERVGSVTSIADIEDIATPVARQSHEAHCAGLCERTQRLVDWNVEMLLGLIQQIVARRDTPSMASSRRALSQSRRGSNVLDIQTTPLEEVKEIICLPDFNASMKKQQKNPDSVRIPPGVIKQLHLLVSEIARRYNDNPFHNFQHASHVVISVIKLMSRINAPSNMESGDRAALHDHTYGITSDPLTQFACAFSALIVSCLLSPYCV